MKKIIPLILGISLVASLGMISKNNEVKEANAATSTKSNYTLVKAFSDLYENDRVVICTLLMDQGITGASNNNATYSSDFSKWINYKVGKPNSYSYTLYDETAKQYVSIVSPQSSSWTAYFVYSSVASQLGLSIGNSSDYKAGDYHLRATANYTSYNLGYPSNSTSNCRFYSDTETSATLFYVYKLNDSVLANAWATNFISSTNSICKDHQSDDNYNNLYSQWSNYKSVYTLLSDSAKNALKKNTSSDSTITNALQRYTHIVNRYTKLDDFLSLRTKTANGSNIINRKGKTNNMIIVVTIIGIAAIGTISGYIFLKKKRQ